VLGDPRLNKGVAFGPEERRALGLVGLIPPRQLTLEEQADRAYSQYLAQPSDLAKNVFLTLLHDRNEVLFYRLLGEHLSELLPVVYTPTIADAIRRFSHEYRRPRGLYLSVDAPGDIETSLRNTGMTADDVDLVVTTDAEGILGIGDWGVGGVEVAVGKLVVYTAAAGIHPHRTLGVLLDVGTNNQDLLHDPLYLGLAHPRVQRAAYDAFVDEYVAVVTRLFPNALLHWEDIGTSNARRILGRWRDSALTFNDDMQGTGAVNLAALLSALRVAGMSALDTRLVIFGAGTAGIGIADQFRDQLVASGLSPAEATGHIWCVDRHGLLVADYPDMLDFQRSYARPAAEVAGWSRAPGEYAGYRPISLAEVVRRVRPHVLVGTSGVYAAFTEEIVREMARHVARPVILPLSNPTQLCEARPADLLAWTDGRALVATGSPFPPVTMHGVTHVIAQANNALVFPGLGLGALVARATRITDRMILAAARAVASLVDSRLPGAPLLPQVEELRTTSAVVAAAVVEAAALDGVARCRPADVATAVSAAMWQPEYRPVLAV
jgi:malate dehydrogenase (oxaloacetate-decarboxylating)